MFKEIVNENYKSKLGLYLSDKVIGVTSKKKLKPMNYKNVVTNGYAISSFGIHFNILEHKHDVRVSYVGLRKYFYLSIDDIADLDIWFNVLKKFQESVEYKDLDIE